MWLSRRCNSRRLKTIQPLPPFSASYRQAKTLPSLKNMVLCSITQRLAQLHSRRRLQSSAFSLKSAKTMQVDASSTLFTSWTPWGRALARMSRRRRRILSRQTMTMWTTQLLHHPQEGSSRVMARTCWRSSNRRLSAAMRMTTSTSTCRLAKMRTSLASMGLRTARITLHLLVSW